MSSMNENEDTSIEDLWDEWAHFNWDDDQDMEYAERAFNAGYAAAQASSAAAWDDGKSAWMDYISRREDADAAGQGVLILEPRNPYTDGVVSS